jgi:multiple sugar transport system ATP-binding protein
MKLGKVQQIGSPIEIYNHPANLFVAGFIGSPAMNFLKVKWDSKKNVATTSDGKEISIPADLVKGYEIPENAILGIRPEDIHPSEKASDNTYDITVNVAELLGHEYYIHTDFGGADLISKFPAKKAISVRDELKVSFDVKKVHFFDPETEKAIF